MERVGVVFIWGALALKVAEKWIGRCRMRKAAQHQSILQLREGLGSLQAITLLSWVFVANEMITDEKENRKP